MNQPKGFTRKDAGQIASNANVTVEEMFEEHGGLWYDKAELENHRRAQAAAKESKGTFIAVIVAAAVAVLVLGVWFGLKDSDPPSIQPTPSVAEARKDPSKDDDRLAQATATASPVPAAASSAASTASVAGDTKKDCEDEHPKKEKSVKRKPKQERSRAVARASAAAHADVATRPYPRQAAPVVTAAPAAVTANANARASSQEGNTFQTIKLGDRECQVFFNGRLTYFTFVDDPYSKQKCDLFAIKMASQHRETTPDGGGVWTHALASASASASASTVARR